jgi:hypothetical protein
MTAQNRRQVDIRQCAEGHSGFFTDSADFIVQEKCLPIATPVQWPAAF